MMTRNGELGEIKVIEWTPGKWWVVQITNKDGSYTPLDGPFDTENEALLSPERKVQWV